MFTWEIISSLFKNPNHVLLKDPVVIMKEIMSWLFKDLINSKLAQIDHGQSTAKNGPKAKKITLPQFFILQNFKKILRADPELWCAIFRTRMAHLFWAIFFKYKPLLLLSFTCWPFSLCKILPVDPELCGCAIFGSKMAHMRIFSENLLMSLVSFIHAICMPKIKGRY